MVSQMRFFVPSLTSFKEGVQHNSLLGQSLWGLRLCEHQEIEAVIITLHRAMHPTLLSLPQPLVID